MAASDEKKCKYLGVLEADIIKQIIMKVKARKDYIRREENSKYLGLFEAEMSNN